MKSKLDGSGIVAQSNTLLEITPSIDIGKLYINQLNEEINY
jgi:hypothetical protein